METHPRYPAHILLGTTPEGPVKGTIKVLIASFTSLLLCGIMLSEELNLLQFSRTVISQKMQKSKSRRIRRSREFEIL